MAAPKINSSNLSPKTSNDESVQSTSGRKKSYVKGIVAAKNHTSSEKLFGGARELVIEHEGDLYLLRLTNLGKLILTK